MFSCLLCYCNSISHFEICQSCFEKLVVDSFSIASSQETGIHVPHSNRSRTPLSFPIMSAGPYEDSWKKLLLCLKTNPSSWRPGTLHFLKSVLKYWLPAIQTLKADYLCAVPSRPWREFMGLSVSKLLTLQLSRVAKIPVLFPGPRQNLIYALRNAPQKNKTAIDRWQNPPRYVWPKISARAKSRVLLVDDLCTSGASLYNLGQELVRQDLYPCGAFTLCYQGTHSINRTLDNHTF